MGGGPKGKQRLEGHERVPAAAMYVLELTRANPEWAAWAEQDTAFVRCGLGIRF